MRLWSLHPRYLDPQGLIALWREGLLAQKVLEGATRGYRHHPQLMRFKESTAPLSAIRSYLVQVREEAISRGYAFDRTKVGRFRAGGQLVVTSGQLNHEWQHLLQKLKVRNPELFRRWHAVDAPQCHPSFKIVPGGVESWER